MGGVCPPSLRLKGNKMKEFLYFSATWCGPCLQLGPIMNELQRDGYKVRKIDVDSDPNTPSQYNVRNIPTVVLLKNGREVARQVGNQTKSRYINLWEQS
jgi:thioredoxin 1